MADRMISLTFYGLACLCGIAAVLILLVGFVDWLQTERWTNLSVLEFGYDAHLIRARWFINNRWSWWLHDLMHLIPLYVFLLALAPLSWVVGAWFGRR
jgi:hypothetical protein